MVIFITLIFVYVAVSVIEDVFEVKDNDSWRAFIEAMSIITGLLTIVSLFYQRQ